MGPAREFGTANLMVVSPVVGDVERVARGRSRVRCRRRRDMSVGVRGCDFERTSAKVEVKVGRE